MCEINRCPWANTPLYIEYHDKEWGRPLHDDGRLFEMLVLESMQAGLAWITVLNKRNAFREAFDEFDPIKIANYDEEKLNELLSNEKIIRNRLKIQSAVNNARVFLEVAAKYGSFDNMIWSYVDNKPLTNRIRQIEEMPASTPLSDKICKDMKKMGFQFIGTTIIYSYMQAVGIVNDHLTDCFVFREIYNEYLDKGTNSRL